MPRIIAGAVAGLRAGVLFGIMMQMMTAPTPEGMRVPMMAMVAMVVGSTSLVVGWIYHLFNSAVIGGLFGLVFGRAVHGVGGGLAWGAIWGIVWWVLGGLVLMPVLLDMPAFAPLQMPEMRMVAVGSLMGHVLYGLVLGGAYAKLARTAASPAGRPVHA